MLSARAWMVAVALAGCGVSKHDRGPTKAASAPPEPTASTAPIYYELCGYLERCHPELATVFSASSFDACREFAACNDPNTHWERTFEDPESCAGFVRDAACGAIVVGTPGGPTPPPYLGSLAIELGAACPRVTRAQPLTPEYAGPGAPCLTSGERACDPDHFCAPDLPLQMVGRAYCGTCAAVAPEGEACGATATCAFGLRCIDGTCHALRDTGAACDQPAQCANYECDEGVCAEQPQLARPLPIAPLTDYLGKACAPRDRADPCFDSPLTDCIDGVCVLRPDVGESCDSLFGLCRVGQFCHEGVCVEVGCRSEIGEPCAGGFCDEGDCSPDTRLCVGAPTLGEPCNTTCRTPYVCDFLQGGICIEPLANGKGCKDDDGCRSRFCDRDYSEYCTPSFCSAPACVEDCGVCADPPTTADCR